MERIERFPLSGLKRCLWPPSSEGRSWTAEERRHNADVLATA